MERGPLHDIRPSFTSHIPQYRVKPRRCLSSNGARSNSFVQIYKWRHERCQAQRVIVKIVRKPKQPCCANTVMPYSCGLTTQLSKTPNAQIPIGQADPSMIKLEPVSCLSASPTPSNTHAQFKRSRVASEKPASMQPSACSRLWLHSTSASTVFAKRTSKTPGRNHRLTTELRTKRPGMPCVDVRWTTGFATSANSLGPPNLQNAHDAASVSMGSERPSNSDQRYGTSSLHHKAFDVFDKFWEVGFVAKHHMVIAL